MITLANVELKPISRINALSRDAKKNYYLDTLRKLLQANPSGLNVTEVSRELNSRGRGFSYNRKTLLNYFSQLVGTREAYYETVGNTLIFKPNGRLLHGDKNCFFTYDNTTFLLFRIDNPNLGGRLMLIQERQATPTGNKISGGIMMPEGEKFRFLSALDNALSKGD